MNDRMRAIVDERLFARALEAPEGATVRYFSQGGYWVAEYEGKSGISLRHDYGALADLVTMLNK